MWPDDVTRAFERYRKLSQATARSVVEFHARRVKLRAEKDAPLEDAVADVSL